MKHMPFAGERQPGMAHALPTGRLTAQDELGLTVQVPLQPRSLGIRAICREVVRADIRPRVEQARCSCR